MLLNFEIFINFHNVLKIFTGVLEFNHTQETFLRGEGGLIEHYLYLPSPPLPKIRLILTKFSFFSQFK